MRLVHRVIFLLLSAAIAMSSRKQHRLALLLRSDFVNRENVWLISRSLRGVQGVSATNSCLVDAGAV